MPEIRTHSGSAALPFLADLARLRISVFREFPYLYQGALEYETAYLAEYFSSDKSLLITAEDDTGIVGASTACPLAESGPAFQSPFLEKSIDLDDIMYFGESVLIPNFRGQGIGRKFFELRESWAKSCGFSIAAFCAIERDYGHPAKPAGYRSLEKFWEGRSYRKEEGLVMKLPWQEVDGEHGDEIDHNLVFWLKPLT